MAVRAYEQDPKSPTGLTNDEIYELTQRQRYYEQRIREAKREVRGAQQVYERDPSLTNKTSLINAQRTLKDDRQSAIRDLIGEANAKCKPGTTVLHRNPRREWAGDMPKLKRDIQIGRSAGAAAWRDDVSIDAARNIRGKIASGSQITGVKTIAGKGTKKKIREASRLTESYKAYGVRDSDWEKQRGTGYVEYPDGNVYKCELHWYYSKQTDRVKMKVKKNYDDPFTQFL